MCLSLDMFLIISDDNPKSTIMPKALINDNANEYFPKSQTHRYLAINKVIKKADHLAKNSENINQNVFFMMVCLIEVFCKRYFLMSIVHLLASDLII